MANKGKQGNNFTPEWFAERGYTPDGKGGYNPPAFKNPFTTPKKPFCEEINNRAIPTPIEKKKAVETPDFEHKPVTEWFIQGYNVPSKKNSRQNFVRNGKQISIPSKAHAHYVKMTDMQYKVFGNEFRRSVEALELKYPLRIEFTFIRGTKQRADFTNALDTVQDIMVSNGWIPDDDMLHIIPSFQPRREDKENPGVIIKLLTNL